MRKLLCQIFCKVTRSKSSPSKLFGIESSTLFGIISQHGPPRGANHAICIYCSETADSLEHPLPAAFGEFENAPQLVDRICRKCNNERLGVLDEQLTRCGPEAFIRRFYGVQGRVTHDPVNSFYRGSAKGQRLEMKVFDPKLGFEVLLECDNGACRQLCQLVFIEQSGKKTHQLPIRQGTSPEQLRAAFNNLGVCPPYDTRVFADPDERAWVEPLLKATWPTFSFGDTGTPASSNYPDGGAVKFTLTNRYFRAVAKIAFHYFLTQFPDLSGHEPAFSDIRQFILDETTGVDRANEFVGERPRPLIGEMLSGGCPTGWVGHALCADITDGECRAHVQLFICEDFQPRVYTVRLGRDAALQGYPAFGHGYLHYPDGRRGRFSGEAVSLTATRADFPPLPLAPVIKST
jgi:hypothetical protein